MLPHRQPPFFSSPIEAPNPHIKYFEARKPQQNHRENGGRGFDINASNWGDVIPEEQAIEVPNAAENGRPIHSELSTEHPDVSMPNSSRQNKRARAESSRAAMSYPRKRAVTACQLCRTRKTKCSNTRPKCKFCSDTGAVCIYEDPLDHSSFDPASLIMLDRLNQILDRLDRPFAFTAPQNPPESSQALHVQPSPISSVSHSSHVHESELVDSSEDEYMKIPSSRTTADTVLLWPIFEGRYPPNFLVESLFDAATDLESDDESRQDSGSSKSRQRPGVGNNLSSGVVEENALGLVDNFLAVVHTKNPILDVVTLKQYARRVAEDGPGWDGKSCLVLLACALGSIAKPFAETWHESAKSALLNTTDDSTTYSMGDLQIAEHYYGLARKRIGLLSNTIIRSQCYLLSGVYLMYVLRPLEAWQNFLQASTTYHVYLKGRMQRVDGERQSSSRTRRLEQRLYWSCFKSECEIRVEMSLPESSIANLRYPDMFPSPPNEATLLEEEAIDDSASYSALASPASSIDTSGRRQRRTESIDGNQAQSWYYYLTEIALRRIGNRILNALYKNSTFPGSDIPVPEMLKIATDFETQLLQWESTLPEILSYNHEEMRTTPTDELSYHVRGRIVEIKTWLYRPFLYHAIHHPADDPYRALIHPLAKKALEYGTYHIEGLNARHRHHGTWYGARSGTTAAFSIIAAVKCGHLDVPETWSDTIQIQIAILKYWEKEAADLAKGRVVLEAMLNELL